LERWDDYHPDKGLDRSGMTSFNHYALGGMGQWLYDGILGIERDPSVPGYERFNVHPRVGGTVTWARGEYQSVHGAIHVDWKKSDGRFTLKVAIPIDTTAEVYMPTPDANSVTEGGQAVAGRAGVRYLKQQDGAAVYQVESGRYEFSSPLEHLIGTNEPAGGKRRNL
jgi:alpha-L-rhamnosidase